MEDTYTIENAECMYMSADALLIEATEFEEPHEWIPRSVVTEDSEVQETGDSGDLVIKEWFAIEKGWV